VRIEVTFAADDAGAVVGDVGLLEAGIADGLFHRHMRPARALAQEALAMGARLYRMSVEPDQELVNAQYGPALATWQSLKRAVDPRGLCNPGLLSLPAD
jgi:FAD/FMN-containing dehydrogenase